MFALLPNKKLITYETLFKKIKEIVGEPNLTQTILTNFEKAVLPHAVLKECRFHQHSESEQTWRFGSPGSLSPGC